MRGDVVQLAAYRSKVSKPAPAKPVTPAYLAAEPGSVVLQFSNRDELVLSPAHARIWAERLAAMADTAEALEREGDR